MSNLPLSSSTLYLYAIEHIASGRTYVGITDKIKERFSTHRSRLKRNVHHSPYLQNAWNKHGASAFDFKVACITDSPDEIERLEIAYIAKFREKDLSYNIDLGGKRNHTLSEETKEKLRVANLGKSPPNKGKPMGDAQKVLLSEAAKKQKRSIWTPEWIENHAKAQAKRKGVPRSAETIAKMSASLKGRISPRKGAKLTPEQKKKIGLASAGHLVKESTRAIMRDKMSGGNNPFFGRKHTQETKDKISRAKKGVKLTKRSST